MNPNWKAISPAEWKQRLTTEQYRVMREQGTEAPFSGEYTDEERPGEYHCAACGQKLFSAKTKFHSGSGWPSFWDVIEEGNVTLYEDDSHGMHRTEVRCGRCDSHLGHVFPDGPADKTGQRYCINSVALAFEATEDA